MRLRSACGPNEPIAVIGTGLRFPGGANTPAKLWELLHNPRDVQSAIPANRFNPDGFNYLTNGQRGSRLGYFLSDDYQQFDAQFFGIKPVEASSMDPQQRLLLEVIYESIEAAGLSMEALRGSDSGVFVGAMAVDFADMLNRDVSDFPSYSASGTARSMLSNRISYFFDWRGPSMTIDTACSSSLVALHQAVQSLRSGESHIAVTAGTNLILGPEQFIVGSDMNMLSPDGRCFMFDARANGYARGEGVAAVVLKTMSAAIADGDDIECVIVETGLNQDGRTKGLTVPSAAAQASLIQATYRKAGLDLTKASDRPQYFEAHGTGTPIGDPVEAEAIHHAFFKGISPDRPEHHLYLGSIKTVIGHTEGTAGLAGLIKASLALRHGVIPPNLNFEDLAPNIKPFYGNLDITTTPKPWPALAPGAVRRASVNSFGFGGTNAHCILETFSPAASEKTKLQATCLPFLFSAPSEKSLSTLLTSYLSYFKSNPTINLRDLSHTLCTRRAAFPIRVSVSSSNLEDLCAKLEAILHGTKVKPTVALPTHGPSARILGIFTGQGAQWAGMASKLLRIPAAVRIVEDLEHSLAELQDPPSWSLRKELSADKSCSRVTEAALAQPACTAVQILLVDLLRAAGINFYAVVGHSSGEIAAAYAAGYISKELAIRIAYYRGVHLNLVGGPNGETGAMLAIGASLKEAQEICGLNEFRGRICVGASNSPASVTLSGDTAAIEEVKAMFQAKGRFARLLRVDNAYHSHHMDRCSEAITASLRACQIPTTSPVQTNSLWVSSVYEKDMSLVTESLNDVYWHSNTVNSVLFSEALHHALDKSSFGIAVEIGAHPALKGPALQVFQTALGRTIPYTGMLSRDLDDVEAFNNGLGYLWANMYQDTVDFAGIDRVLSASGCTKVLKGLPTYPWEHERAFWYESRASHAFRHRSVHHELLGIRNHDYSADHISWKNCLSPKHVPWLSDHCVQNQIVFPGAAYISSAFEAAVALAAGRPVKLIELENFVFVQPLVFESDDSAVEVVVSLNAIEDRKSSLTANFTYHSVARKENGPMTLNAHSRLNLVIGESDQNILQAFPEQQFGMTGVDQETIYQSFATCGYQYSGAFKALSSVERKSGSASGRIQVPETDAKMRLLMHPATLDVAMHSILVAFCYPGDGTLTSILLPTDVSKITINPGAALRSSCEQYLRFVSYSSYDDVRNEGDVHLFPGESPNAILQLEGLHTKPMVPASPANDILMFSETVWGPASPVLENALEQVSAIKPCLDQNSRLMGSIVRQIGHRYPAINILQYGASDNDATKSLLLALDDSFASYTYTDISVERLDLAKTVFKAYDDKMMYKALKTEDDIFDQGFTKHSFDVVVAWPMSSDNTDLEITMKNVRQLLKPGGYFLRPRGSSVRRTQDDSLSDIVSERTSNHDCESFSPVSADDSGWRLLTERYNFAPHNLLSPAPSCGTSHRRVFLMQAVDDRIKSLREPLSSTKEPLSLPGITLVGGMTAATSVCIKNLAGLLQAYSVNVNQVKRVPDLVDVNLAFGGTILLLQDHDKPLFQDLDAIKLQGLQKLFNESRNILWVTHGYMCNQPYARMLVAFARCLMQEMPHARLQILDLPLTAVLDARIISENLLRLVLTDTWEEQGRLNDLLWTFEPEISYDGKEYFIPRIKLNKDMNDRYNSARRPITKTVDPTATAICIAVKEGKYVLQLKNGLGPAPILTRADVVTVCVSHSLLKAVKLQQTGYFHLLLGTDRATNEQVVALSNTLSSEVDVPRRLVRVCSLPKPRAIGYLRALLHGFISSAILQDLYAGDSVVILGPSRDAAALISCFAAAQHVQVVFVAVSSGTENHNGWKYLTYNPSRRDVIDMLPQNLSRVICWQTSTWTSTIRQHTPSDVPFLTLSSFLGMKGSKLGQKAINKAADVFDHTQNHLAPLAGDFQSLKNVVVPLSSVDGVPFHDDHCPVLSWVATSKVPIKVEPVDCGVLFRPDKAYWLVGLTGGLGLSLCEWMISRGARYIAISSRRPNIDGRWLAHFKSLNATVRVYANDVTDRGSVLATYDKIQRERSIGGVIHGAMVLQDALFQNLDIARVEKVLRPKVNGAIHLDEILYSQHLDFFIVLSSIAAIMGNPGQTAYAAANGFLAGLAAERRRRGVAASVVNVGAILGNGYASRGLTSTQRAALHKAGVMWTSEQDFHAAVAEAVITSPPKSESGGEFTTGVRISGANDRYQLKYANSPIFAHLVQHSNVSERPIVAGSIVKSARAQLLQARTSQTAVQILEDLLSLKLRKALQLPADTAVIDQTAETLGIDSIIAVEIRSWLMRELTIDMPILKIIGGGTMRGVTEKALELLDPATVPSLTLGVAPTTQVRNPVAAKHTGNVISTLVHNTRPADLRATRVLISTTHSSYTEKDAELFSSLSQASTASLELEHEPSTLACTPTVLEQDDNQHSAWEDMCTVVKVPNVSVAKPGVPVIVAPDPMPISTETTKGTVSNVLNIAHANISPPKNGNQYNKLESNLEQDVKASAMSLSDNPDMRPRPSNPVPRRGLVGRLLQSLRILKLRSDGAK